MYDCIRQYEGCFYSSQRNNFRRVALLVDFTSYCDGNVVVAAFAVAVSFWTMFSLRASIN